MTWRVPHDLAVVEDGEATVYLLRLPDGVPIALRGPAAVIWRTAARGSADPAREVADLVIDPPSDLGEVVAAFLDELVARGLLISA